MEEYSVLETELVAVEETVELEGDPTPPSRRGETRSRSASEMTPAPAIPRP